MKIEEFYDKYSSSETYKMENLIDKWVIEKRLDELLGFAAITGGDLLIGDGLLDAIPGDVRDSFQHLMGEKAHTFEQVRQIILDKARDGSPSLSGLVNKIQGQLGEDLFVKATPNASLASLHNQPGFDVKINHGDFTQYVQVKVYDDANAIAREIQDLQAKIDAGQIMDGEHTVKAIDWAVPSDMVDHVQQKVDALGLNVNVLDLHESHERIRAGVSHAANNVSAMPLDHFFSELLGASATAAAIHGAIQAFLVYKNAKEWSQAMEDAAVNTAISVGGISAAYTYSFALAKFHASSWLLAGTPGGILAVGLGLAVRGVLRRFADRRFICRRLALGNRRHRRLVAVLKSRTVPGRVETEQNMCVGI